VLLLEVLYNVVITVNYLYSSLIALRVAVLTELELYLTTVLLSVLQISSMSLNLGDQSLATQLAKMLYAVAKLI
jgi:hypothetical protein